MTVKDVAEMVGNLCLCSKLWNYTCRNAADLDTHGKCID